MRVDELIDHYTLMMFAIHMQSLWYATAIIPKQLAMVIQL